jgi:hypothetical protein
MSEGRTWHFTHCIHWLIDRDCEVHLDFLHKTDTRTADTVTLGGDRGTKTTDASAARSYNYKTQQENAGNDDNDDEEQDEKKRKKSELEREKGEGTRRSWLCGRST